MRSSVQLRLGGAIVSSFWLPYARICLHLADMSVAGLRGYRPVFFFHDARLSRVGCICAGSRSAGNSLAAVCKM
jgi:hypothetical protein